MASSMQEKQHVGKEIALRYLRVRKKEKGVMLQEFCATTGYSPPYAAFLLRTYAKQVILGAVTLVATRPSPFCTPPDGVCHHGPAAAGGEDKGREPEALLPDNTREPPGSHPL